MRCARPHCNGTVLQDDDGRRCSFCGRSPERALEPVAVVEKLFCTKSGCWVAPFTSQEELAAHLKAHDSQRYTGPARAAAQAQRSKTNIVINPRRAG